MKRATEVVMGRCVSFLLFGLLVVVALPSASLAQDCGDVNGDGSLTASDALLALRTAVGSAAPCDFCVCDANCDRSSTASDALEILRGAIGSVELGCCVIDGCFSDEDCALGEECTSPAAATCDLQCVSVTTSTTSTTSVAVDECFKNADCLTSGFPEGYVCAGFKCVECDTDAHCSDGLHCVSSECLPTATP